MVLLQSKLYFSKEPEGVQHFPGGGSNCFQGVQIQISIVTHITCDFPGGWVGPPIPPLDPLMMSGEHLTYYLVNNFKSIFFWIRLYTVFLAAN